MPVIYVIGTGPGSPEMITPQALKAMRSCDVIVGYTKYVDLVKDLVPQKIFYTSGMTHEIERCEAALKFAKSDGLSVALISSGDSGVYGMAGLMLEVAAGSGVKVKIIPGITAANSCASLLGAPLMNDYAVISLSDLMTDWNVIEKRLIAACLGDFVICIYNPSSHGRPEHLKRACDVLLKHKSPQTPAGFVRSMGREGQAHEVITLAELRERKNIDMLCTVIIGNSKTYVLDGIMITPRGYGR